MGKSRNVLPSSFQGPYATPQFQAQPQKAPAHRSEAATINDLYLAAAKTSSLNAVSLMALDSILTVHEKSLDILALHPELDALVKPLQVNHAMLLTNVQRSISHDERKDD